MDWNGFNWQFIILSARMEKESWLFLLLLNDRKFKTNSLFLQNIL